ncbi:MAG: putative zinc-binding protein [Bacteroidales bacterium]|nr:putative zinc-binding protein [Bacteroidales bacterium]
MENQNLSCSCNDKAEKIVMSCSGASDVGQISDLLARKLRDNKVRSMKCLTMIAIDNKPLIEAVQNSNTLVIDGCPIDCGRRILEKAGLSNFSYMRITDYGLVKGKTPVNVETINTVYQEAIKIL